MNKDYSSPERGEMSDRPMICPGASARTRRLRASVLASATMRRRIASIQEIRRRGSSDARNHCPEEAEEHTQAAINARSPSEPGSNIRANKPRGDRSSAELAARPIEDPESSRFINRLNHLSHTVDRARRAHDALHHKRARSRWTQWKAEQNIAEFTQQDADLVGL